ncbi:hypothetical protein, partial [Staphylococcus felis]|uniref:hypothetical protein n=1 Tax=Staphylococcus felis TaxID=46127 RepID=UPI000E384C54
MTECPRCHQISNHNAYCQNCQLQISYSINSSNSNSSDMNEKRKASAHHSKQWPIKKMIPIGIIGFDVHPKSWTKKSNFMGCIFMGKHYKFEIKLKIVQEYLNSSLG